MTRIASLGLGRMGAPMAGRLLAAGHDLAVWNRTPASGTAAATSPHCPTTSGGPRRCASRSTIPRPSPPRRTPPTRTPRA
nr:NAD(P)-binding domain-containing protein [Actinomadura chibensis]